MLTAVSVGLALLVSLLAPLFIRPLLQRMGVIDVPNERSSHSRPILRGVGLAPLLAVMAGFAVLIAGGSERSDASLLMVIALVALLCGVLGWLEDSRGLPVTVRAGSQLVIGVAGAGFAVALSDSFWWLVPILGIGIAGYINVANFMDGINGISGLHGATVGVVYVAIGGLTTETWMIPAGLVIAVSFLGFLPWNLMRGGVFLGDVGSYALGGVIAIVAATAVAKGVPVLAVLGPLVIYLADAGVTLIRRVASGKRWYEAHRTHTYQRLTDVGMSHLKVALIVGLASAGAAASGLIAIHSGPGWLLSALLMLTIVVAYLFLEAFILRLRNTKRRVPMIGTEQ